MILSLTRTLSPTYKLTIKFKQACTVIGCYGYNSGETPSISGSYAANSSIVLDTSKLIGLCLCAYI